MAGPRDAPAGACGVRVGLWLVEPSLNRVSDNEKVHHLQPQVMDLLVFLASNPNRVVSKDEIIGAVWKGRFISETTLTRSVADLRRALEDDVRKPTFLETIPKRGYRLIAPVAAVPHDARHPGGSPPADATAAQIDQPAPSLLVLPFESFGSNPDERYFCDGLTEEVINVLTRVPGLRVIARASAFAAAATGADLAETAARLNVTFVVEGSVRRAEGRLRVTAQLIRASDQCHVWSERYDRAPADVFAIQDEIAEAIAARLRLSLSGPRRAPVSPSTDLAAYTAYLEGRHHFFKATAQSLVHAKTCYDRALSIDPALAVAHDALSEVYWYMGFFGALVPKEAFSLAVWESLRALEIDDTLAEAHAQLAMLRKELDYNWPEVRREFDRALELNPNSPTVRLRHAVCGLMPHGKLEEAAAVLRDLLETDPLAVFVRLWLATMYLLSRQFPRVREEGHRIIEIDAGHWAGYHVLGAGKVMLGEAEEAVLLHERAVDLGGGAPWLRGWLGLAYGAAGRHDEARALLEELLEMSSHAYVSPTAVAFTCIGLGQVDAAFEWMDRAVEVRDPHIIPIRTYPCFDGIRDDERFRAILGKMNLIEAD